MVKESVRLVQFRFEHTLSMSEHVCVCVLVLTVQQSSLATCFTKSGGLPDGFGKAATHQKSRQNAIVCLNG